MVYLAASSQFKPQDEDVIEKVLQKYKIKKPYILSVSTQEPRKNIQKLIDSFEKIKKGTFLSVTGRIKPVQYQTKAGVDKQTYEIVAYSIKLPLDEGE